MQAKEKIEEKILQALLPFKCFSASLSLKQFSDLTLNCCQILNKSICSFSDDGKQTEVGQETMTKRYSIKFDNKVQITQL